MLYAGMPSLRTRSPYKALIGVYRGGTAGCVLAGRLAENPELSILLVEAGPPIEAVPASAMPAAFVFPKAVLKDDHGANFYSKLGPGRGHRS